MVDTTTAVYEFVAPEIGGSDDTWGNKLNEDLILKLEALFVDAFSGGSPTDLGVLKQDKVPRVLEGDNPEIVRIKRANNAANAVIAFENNNADVLYAGFVVANSFAIGVDAALNDINNQRLQLDAATGVLTLRGTNPGLLANYAQLGTLHLDPPGTTRHVRGEGVNLHLSANEGNIFFRIGAVSSSYVARIDAGGTAANDAITIMTREKADNRYLQGPLTAGDIPSLGASKITSGTFNDARIPNLNASKITAGTFDDARIPNLNASKITAGTFNDARIPDLNASKITAGTFADARIPNLNASKINAGTLNSARLPTGTAGRDWVLARLSDITNVNTVGSYAFLRLDSDTRPVNPNATVSGSGLSFSSGSAGNFTGSPSGTWRCMGSVGTNADNAASLFLRIA